MLNKVGDKNKVKLFNYSSKIYIMHLQQNIENDQLRKLSVYYNIRLKERHGWYIPSQLIYILALLNKQRIISLSDFEKKELGAERMGKQEQIQKKQTEKKQTGKDQLKKDEIKI